MQTDDSIMAARYILLNNINNSRDSVVIQRYSRWARYIFMGYGEQNADYNVYDIITKRQIRYA